MDLTCQEATVIGGGFSGLLFADVLASMGYRVELFEASQRLGGLIDTFETPFGSAETAAHSFLGTPSIIEFLKALNVEWSELRRGSNARYIFRNAKMRRLPLRFFEILGMLRKAISKPAFTYQDSLTLLDWGHTYLGEAAGDALLAPLVSGIYAAQLDEIEVRAAFPSWEIPPGKSFVNFLWGKRKESGPKRVHPKMISPIGGMVSVVRALERELRKNSQVNLYTGRCIRDLPKAKNCVLAVPARVAGQLLAGVDATLAEALGAVRYAPLIAATVFVQRGDLKRIPTGVGVLRAKETSGQNKMTSLGILLNSSSFANRVKNESHHLSMTFMLGGTADPTCLDRTDEELREMIRSDLQLLFGFHGDLLGCFVSRHRQAIPIYNRHLRESWDLARKGWCSKPGRVLFGNYTGQVSLRGMIEGVKTRKLQF